MERRTFLAVGAASVSSGLGSLNGLPGAPGAAAAATADDASPAPPDAQARLSAAEIDAYLQTLDRGLSHIGSKTGWLERQILAVPGGQPLLGDAARDELSRCEALSGKILRGLLTLGSFRDLPEHGRVHPGMQRRMGAAIEESSQAMAELATYLEGFSAADRLDLEATLRGSPQVIERLARELDLGAEQAGLPTRRRQHTQMMMKYLQRHLSRHSSAVIFDDYLEQVQAMVRRPGAQQEYLAYVVKRVGTERLAEYQTRLQELAATWATTSHGDVAFTAPLIPPKLPNLTSNILLVSSGVLMGLATLAGIICIAFPEVAICALTPLAVFFLSGLITLVVGLAKRRWS